MSWLMSAKRRAKEGLLQAVGAHHATEDLEFDQKLKNFTDQVNNLEKVKAAMDLWVESFDTFGAATLMLSEAFKGFFAFKPSVDDDVAQPLPSPFVGVAGNFTEIAKKLNRVILPSVRQLFELRCLQPTASILALVGPIDALLQERKSVLLDFDSYRAKIEKEHAAGRDSRHPLVVKKAIKLDEVAKQLHSLNTTICASFAEFEKARLITLGPEFTAFVACFYHFSSYSTELSSKVVPGLPQIASSLFILESFIGQSFTDLSNLEISPVVFPAVEPQGDAEQSEENTDAQTPSAPSGAVLERSEYAGGGYGGYASHSTVMPASYKDGLVEQAVTAEAELQAQLAAEAARREAAEAALIESYAAAKKEAAEAEAVAAAAAAAAPTEPEQPSALAASPAPAAAVATPVRTPLPVAQAVDVGADNAGEDVPPLAEASVQVRPPKPPKTDNARAASPVPLHRAASANLGASENSPTVRHTVAVSRSTGTAADLTAEELAAHRSTIALARGTSGSVDLNEDMAQRRPMDPTLTPPSKPIKPPKPARSPVPGSESSTPRPGGDNSSVDSSSHGGGQQDDAAT